MQVVVNLIKNAYEAIDDMDGPVDNKEIGVASFVHDEGIGFEISDTGIGIEPEMVKRIFEFGESGKGSSGFGLYYCKMFVEANKGQLTVDSDGKGKGSRVTVIFNRETLRNTSEKQPETDTV